jgi:ATP-dependent Clp protease adaptor protein ClpS
MAHQIVGGSVPRIWRPAQHLPYKRPNGAARPAAPQLDWEQFPMSDITTHPTTKPEIKPERPRLHKVILINDDYTPREFVVAVLKAEFRMSESQAHRVMITAHRRGVCVVAVFTREVAEAKATSATEAARKQGYPLLFTTEPDE